MSAVGISFYVAWFTRDSNFHYAFAWSVPSMALVYYLSFYQNSTRFIVSFFQNWIFVFLGDISFELYLFHQIVIRYLLVISRIMGITLFENKWMLAFFSLGISIVLALSWRKYYPKINKYIAEI